MEYLIIFLEGVITFISPCILPMVPIYLIYLAGSGEKKNRVIVNSIGFILGFTVIFVLLGALAGSLKILLRPDFANAVNIVCGAIVILFGLDFLGVLKIPFIGRSRNIQMGKKDMGFPGSVVFGIVFGTIWTPCVTAFLGMALMMAMEGRSVLKGVLLLLCYSLGLAVPFLFSAVLLEQLKAAFDFIKRHYKIINSVSGVIMIITGILMATGRLGMLLNALS